jgi:hypothetical protein
MNLISSFLRGGRDLKKYIMAGSIKQLNDVLLYLKWGNISKDYFGFSRGWIYQRLNGYDGNGEPCDFTESQKEILREALKDISKKLSEAADNL